MEIEIKEDTLSSQEIDNLKRLPDELEEIQRAYIAFRKKNAGREFPGMSGFDFKDQAYKTIDDYTKRIPELMIKRNSAVEHFEKTTIYLSEQLELLQELCLPNFQKRKFLNRRKFRLFFFDIIAPVLMLIILVFATFFTTKFNYLINILVG